MGSLGTNRARQTFVRVSPTTPISTTPVNQNNPSVQSQVPNDTNTPVVQNAVTNLTSMTDDELASVVNASKSAIMPNFLSDVNDATQKFVYQIGLNEKPTVLDNQAFNQFMQDNNISSRQMIARSVDDNYYTNNDGTRVNLTANDITDIMMYSKLNYIGGKHGGMAYGAGTYFDMNGGKNTGYGNGKTAVAVLDPAKTKAISINQLRMDAQSWAASHPKSASAIGSFTTRNSSIYALAMGYNVITSGRGYGISVGDYHNVIDRSVLVYRK